MNFRPRYTITDATANSLATIERARGFLEGAKLSHQLLERMGQRALLLEAHHTTHIEGTQLTIEQAQQIWNGGVIPGTNPEDARELLNYRRAFDVVSQFIGSDSPVTEVLIREIQRLLVDGVRGQSASAGNYRKVQNYVAHSASGQIIYTPPGPQEVPALMHELVLWLNDHSEIHPVIVAGIAQFQLVHIHPFVDGNGRASRLLSTLMLYRAGYDFKRLFTLSEFYDRDRTAFYDAIQSVRRDMDLTPWVEFFAHGLATQLTEVKSHVEYFAQAETLAKAHSLNDRQTSILQQLVVSGMLGITDLERQMQGIKRRTLQRDLRFLVESGLIEQVGDGPTDPQRKYVYRRL